MYSCAAANAPGDLTSGVANIVNQVPSSLRTPRINSGTNVRVQDIEDTLVPVEKVPAPAGAVDPRLLVAQGLLASKRPALGEHDVMASKESRNVMLQVSEEKHADAKEALPLMQSEALPPPRAASEWVKDQEQFAHLPPLPDGWMRVKSRQSGQIYYCHRATGKTTFTEPTVSTGINPETGLPPGWIEKVSRTNGKAYYWNAQLQVSQFERPT